MTETITKPRATELDPVCGMPISREGAAITRVFDGSTKKRQRYWARTSSRSDHRAA